MECGLENPKRIKQSVLCERTVLVNIAIMRNLKRFVRHPSKKAFLLFKVLTLVLEHKSNVLAKVLAMCVSLCYPVILY